MKMKRTLVLALVLILFIVAVHATPSVMATDPEANSTMPSAVTVHLEPTTESVYSVKTTVDSTTVKINPLEFAAAPVEPTPSTLSLQYIPIVIGLTLFGAVLLFIKITKNGGYTIHLLHFLSSSVILGLLVTSAVQVRGEETMSLTTWDLGAGYWPIIVRDSIDSAGNVWFSSYYSPTDDANRIHRLNPLTNEVNTWVTPESYGAIVSVSIDGSDNVWFADINLHRVGRLDTSNFFTIWPITGIDCLNRPTTKFPHKMLSLPLISTDSKGNAYFPEYSTNKIGCIDPNTNSLTEWTIPTIDSKPGYVMVDSNDNVWFAEFSGNKIGRLNPNTNEITEWLIPTPDCMPSGLYVAQELVYFAEYGAHKIGSLDPNTNEITQWSLTGFSVVNPIGLFVDTNRCSWFVASHSGQAEYGATMLVRMNAENILTYWQFNIYTHTSFGAAVDTKVNVGSVYVSTSTWSGTADKSTILRFLS